MATIALYANKVNQMPGLIKDVKKSVSNYKTELSSLKKKTLSVNQNVCNLDDVIGSIQSSTQTQEQKIAFLDTFHVESEQFISNAVSIDGQVAEVVNKRKDDFYEQYYYLKPECEKSTWEKFKDGCAKVGEWCKEHWKLIVTALIIIASVIVLVCFPAAAPILLLAAKGAIVGTVTGGVIGGVTSLLSGGSFLEGFENGAFSGAISGAIFGGIGGAGQMVGKVLAGSCKALKIISTTFKVSAGITSVMGGFDLLAMGLGLWDPNNPLFLLNQELHKSSLYNGFQIFASVVAAFSGGAYLKMKQYPSICFVAGTMILTATGLIAIENIKVGDEVISTDLDTSITEKRRVVQTYVNQASHLVHLSVHNEVITTTLNHPFYVKDQGFVKASELQAGNEVMNVAGGNYIVENISIEIVEKPETVYNFEVEEFHTYYVGESSILVHNKCEGELESGLTEVRINEIVNTPKGKRPDPTTYLSKDYIDTHLSQFDEGISVIQTDWAYSRYSEINGFVGVPDDNTLFVMPKAYCDNVISKADGNISIIETELGFPKGYFSDGGGLVRIDVDNISGLNVRMPNGNEIGANSLWLPGGYTSGEVPEAITDIIQLDRTNISRININ